MAGEKRDGDEKKKERKKERKEERKEKLPRRLISVSLSSTVRWESCTPVFVAVQPCYILGALLRFVSIYPL